MGSTKALTTKRCVLIVRWENYSLPCNEIRPHHLVWHRLILTKTVYPTWWEDSIPTVVVSYHSGGAASGLFAKFHVRQKRKPLRPQLLKKLFFNRRWFFNSQQRMISSVQVTLMRMVTRTSLLEATAGQCCTTCQAMVTAASSRLNRGSCQERLED